MGFFSKKKKTVTVEETVTTTSKATMEVKNEESFAQVAPKNVGKLDMVIAFDTTGSMSQYIGAVRKEVSELIPQLFKDNEDLHLGIVAFGDYCDMNNAQDFGDAYQCAPLTANENELIKFVLNSKDTSGGDGPEFYELVIKKIVKETQWREGSTRSILLIADAVPHEVGYCYGDIVKGAQIDWRIEARKAADKKIKIDTVTITDAPWFREVSALTNGVSVPFHTGYKTAELLRASVNARGSMKSRAKFDELMDACDDDEMKEVYASYKKERDSFDI